MKLLCWSLLCLLTICVGQGYGIQCYLCHQTSKECNNGAVEYLIKKNCTEDKCAVMKYETPMPGRKVLATLRDCASYTQHEFIQTVSPDMKTPAKVIIFQECSTPFCNGASTERFWSSACTLIIISVYVNLFK